MEEAKRSLSKDSKAFLENLRLYLFSSGKNDEEVNSIVEELEVHLIEAEAHGKSVDQIIGQSPKQYMELISNEMTIDKKTWFKYILVIILGSFSYSILSDIVQGKLSYSLLEIIGYILIALIFISSLLSVFKYTAASNLSKTKEYSLYYIIGILPIVLFIGLIYLNRQINTPIIVFNTSATIISTIIALVLLIGISFWAKSWAVLIILGLLLLPDLVFHQFDINTETQLILSSVITFGGIGLYIYLSSNIRNAKA